MKIVTRLNSRSVVFLLCAALAMLIVSGCGDKKSGNTDSAAPGSNVPNGATVEVQGPTGTKTMTQELAKAEADIKRVDAKLGNEKFVANAPEEIVEEEKEKREAAVARKAKIVEALERLKKRAAEVGQKQLAAELGVDRGNLSAMLAGRRAAKVA